MITRSPRPTLCAVVGDHGAGKRSLVRGLAEILGAERCTILALDDYASPASAASASGADRDPVAVNLALMAQHLRLLRQGETIFKPVVDAASGRFAAPEFVRPTSVILAHGLHGLAAPEIRALWDVSVFIDAAAPSADVERHILPQRERADLVIVTRPVGAGDRRLRYELRIARPLPLPVLAALDAEPAARSALSVDSAAGGADVIVVNPAVDDVSAALIETRLLAALPQAPTRRQLRLGLRRSAEASAARSNALAITQLLVAHYLVQRGLPRPTVMPAVERSVQPAPGA